MLNINSMTKLVHVCTYLDLRNSSNIHRNSTFQASDEIIALCSIHVSCTKQRKAIVSESVDSLCRDGANTP